jgi:hypothetical protein
MRSFIRILVVTGVLISLGMLVYPPWTDTLDLASYAGAALHYEQFGGWFWFWEEPDNFRFLIPVDHVLTTLTASKINVGSRLHYKLPPTGSRIYYAMLLHQMAMLWLAVGGTYFFCRK